MYRIGGRAARTGPFRFRPGGRPRLASSCSKPPPSRLTGGGRDERRSGKTDTATRRARQPTYFGAISEASDRNRSRSVPPDPESGYKYHAGARLQGRRHSAPPRSAGMTTAILTRTRSRWCFLSPVQVGRRPGDPPDGQYRGFVLVDQGQKLDLRIAWSWKTSRGRKPTERWRHQEASFEATIVDDQQDKPIPEADQDLSRSLPKRSCLNRR